MPSRYLVCVRPIIYIRYTGQNFHIKRRNYGYRHVLINVTVMHTKDFAYTSTLTASKRYWLCSNAIPTEIYRMVHYV